jgi:type I restriction enzyme S subunit
VAVVPENLEGGYVSGEFPTFTPTSQKLEPRWFHWLTKRPSFWDQCDEKSRGTSGKNRIKPERFLEIEIPLPPLAEQRRIVARIEALAAKIEEARGLRQQTDEETGVLATRACSQILDNPRWEFKRLEFVLAETPRNGLSPQRETETNGRPMLRINAVSSTPSRFVDLSAYKNVEVSEGVASPFVLQHDDVFIVRYNGDINRVAKAAIFKGEEDTKVVYPDKLMRLRTDIKKMLPDFLVFALGSRTVRKQIEELGKTTAGQIGVSGADAKSFVVPVPPVEEQRRIVTYLDRLQAKVDALKKLQAETAAELTALLPSILDKAFKGEL